MQVFRVLTSMVLSLLSTSAFAAVAVEIPSAEKAQLEAPLKQIGFPKATLEVVRLGGEGLSTYNFKLGRLSPNQFKYLQDLYRLPLNPQVSWVEYSPQRSYDLIDFLPPKMQAPLGKTFEAAENVTWLQSLNGSEETEYFISTNCWSTAYDILRSGQDLFTSYLYAEPNDVEVASLMRNESYSQKVTDGQFRPYDYVLYQIQNDKGQWGLDHVAVHLGFGLVYEKTGSAGGLDYYEIRPLNVVTQQRMALNSGTQVRVEHRRLKKDLPHPYSVWSAKARGLLTSAQLTNIPTEYQDQIVLFKDPNTGDAYNRIRPIHIVATNKGRYKFDSRDPLAREFKGSRIVGSVEKGTSGFAKDDLKTPLCLASESLNVEVVGAKGQSFLVKVSDYQFDDSAFCKDAQDRAIKKFWVPADAVSSQ